MTEQEEKQEIDKKCDEFCEYRRTHSNGYPPREWFMAGVKALDEIRKPSEPDKELLAALKALVYKFDYSSQVIYSHAKIEIDKAMALISKYESK